jgi:hypothetical protein
MRYPWYITLTSISTANRVGSLDEGHITSITLRALKRWLRRKIQPSHIRVQSKYAFTSNGTWASEQRNLTIKPRLHPSSEPLVLDSYRKLRPLTSAFRMEVKAPILPLHLNPINLYLPQLIM